MWEIMNDTPPAVKNALPWGIRTKSPIQLNNKASKNDISAYGFYVNGTQVVNDCTLVVYYR